MLNFFTHLFKKSEKINGDSGFSVPQKRDLSVEENQALNLLLVSIFSHLDEDSANASIVRVRQHFISGENFYTAMSIGVLDSDPIAYLAVDINDAESAAGFAKELSKAHGLIPPFQFNYHNKSVVDVLGEFDRWLSEHKYRFAINTDVDWGYEGFIIAEASIDLVIQASKVIGVGFAIGCREE